MAAPPVASIGLRLPLALYLLPLALVLLLTGRALHMRRGPTLISTLGWAAACIGLTYAVRGAYGLLAAAALAYFLAPISSWRMARPWSAAVAAVAAIALAELVDLRAQDLFLFLPVLELGTTPVTR